MPIRNTAAKAPAQKKLLPQTLTPWSCNHGQDKSEIEAYCLASGKRQVIAEVPYSNGIDHQRIAEFIGRAVNDYEPARELICSMAQVLEKFLELPTITWEAEHDADILVRRAREWLERSN